VKELLKSVHFCQSYHKKIVLVFFLTHGVFISTAASSTFCHGVVMLCRLFCQHKFIVKLRSPKVLFDLIQRTKDAVRELDNQIGSRFKKLLVESPANYHTPYQPVAAAAAAEDDDDDDDEAADDSSVSFTCDV